VPNVNYNRKVLTLSRTKQGIFALESFNATNMPKISDAAQDSKPTGPAPDIMTLGVVSISTVMVL